RNPDIYLGALRAALDRFGVPARFYFSGPLGESGVVRFLGGVVEALLSGWDYAGTLAALRFSGDSSALDHFDFAVREHLPGRGLDGIKALTGDAILQRTLDDLAALDPWRNLSLSAPQWALRLASLRRLVQPPRPVDGAPCDRVEMWRAQSAALAA